MNATPRWIAAGLLAALAACGPGSGNNPKGKVALVDAEEVARALGRNGVLAAYEAGPPPRRGEGPADPAGETPAVAGEQDARREQIRAELIRSFRAEIRPAARRVAQQEGMSMVMMRRDDVVLYTSETNDITQKVIDQLQGQAASTTGSGSSGGSGGSSGGSGGSSDSSGGSGDSESGGNSDGS